MEESSLVVIAPVSSAATTSQVVKRTLLNALCALAGCCPLIASAQWQQQWLTPWNADHIGAESPSALRTDSMGNYLIAGRAPSSEPVSTDHGYVSKYDPNGALQWIFMAEDDVSFYGGSSFFFDMAVNVDGNIALVGDRELPYNDYDGILVYLSQDGDTLWRRVMESSMYDDDGFRLVRTLPDTTILVAGRKYNGVDPFDHGLVLRKYDRHGQQIWQRQDPLMNEPLDMMVASTGDIYVTGFTNAYDKDLVTERFTASGVPKWTTTKDGSTLLGNSSYDTGNQLAELPNGDIVVGGELGIAAFDRDAYLAVFDTSGNQRWEQFYGAPDTVDGSKLMRVDLNGDIIFEMGSEADFNGYAAELMKLDSAGGLIWSVTIGDADYQSGYICEDMAITSTNDIMLCGRAPIVYDSKSVVWLCDDLDGNFQRTEFINGNYGWLQHLVAVDDACAVVLGTRDQVTDGQTSDEILGKYCSTNWLGVAPRAGRADAVAWPQPFASELNIALHTTASTAQIRILDPLGRIVHEEQCASTTALHDLQALPTGAYVLYWSAKDEQGAVRIVKE
jgi:hypothetical protein